MKIGNVIASTIALVWGVAVLIHHFAAAPAATSGAYGAGRSMGLLFAVALGAAGGRGLAKEIQRGRAG